MVDFIWDIETYPNCFTACFINAENKAGYLFEISDRKDEREQMFEFLRKVYKNKDRLVGFNSIGFDYPVLHMILKNKKVTVEDIYDKAMSIIEAGDDEKFAHLIKPKDVLIPQIDLYKIHHFDNKARATSLKVIEFNMRSKTIEDLPFPVGTNLTSDQIDTLIEYNKHDVIKTLDFYKESLGKIAFRESLTEKYGRDFMNHNDTKVGKDYFIMRLEEADPNSCYDTTGYKRKMKQTIRDKIYLKDCLFDYVKFDRPEFNAVKEWLSKQTITETKGVFSDILESDLGDVAQYAEMKIKRKKLLRKPSEQTIKKYTAEKPSGWFEEVPLKTGNKVSYYFNWRVAETLNVVVDGMRYDFGTGGLHGSLSNTIVKEDENHLIIDLDVASFYPNMAISNRVYPEHLGDLFCKIYKDVYEQRKTFGKGTDENATMKLALNGVYGDSNNQYSPFYDPMYTMKITINGQLSLCMLIDMVLKLEGVKVIQANTDGCTFIVPKDKEEEFTLIHKEWESLVKLELERADYQAMFIADVNNYIAQYKDGNVKRKGRYEYEGLGYHQNHSTLVIPMAAEHHLLGRGTIEEFISNHKEKFDFMHRVKVPKSSRLVSIDEFGVETLEQNICRYYVSNDGVELIKIMPPLKGGKDIKVWYDSKKDKQVETDTPTKHRAMQERADKSDGKITLVKEYFKDNGERHIGIEAGQKVTVCNNIDRFNGDINYEYYISKCNELVDMIVYNHN